MPTPKYLKTKETRTETAKKQLVGIAKLIRGECGTPAGLAKVMHCCHERAARRLNQPEELTLGELVDICIALDISCDDVKAKLSW